MSFEPHSDRYNESTKIYYNSVYHRMCIAWRYTRRRHFSHKRNKVYTPIKNLKR